MRSGELLLGQINVQSMKPHLPELRLDVLQYDAIALCETWLSPKVPQRLLTVDGYQLFRRDRPAASRLPRGRGGVAVLARECLSVRVIDVPSSTDSNLESIWTAIGSGHTRFVTLCSFYRHPTQTVAQISADLDDIERQIQYVLTTYPGPIVLAGDHNLNQLKLTCSHARRFADLLNTYELRMCNSTVPTYRPANSVIDVIAVRPAHLHHHHHHHVFRSASIKWLLLWPSVIQVVQNKVTDTKHFKTVPRRHTYNPCMHSHMQ